MPRFEARELSTVVDGETERFHLLEDNDTGSRVIVAHRGASLQQYAASFERFGKGLGLVDLCYSHFNWADFQRGMPRQQVRDVPDAETLVMGTTLMRLKPTWAGDAWLGSINRFIGGTGAILDDHGAVRRHLTALVNHPDSGSYLHDATMGMVADLIDVYAGDDFAYVEFEMPMGTGFESGYPEGVKAVLRYTLTPEMLTDGQRLVNGSEIAVPMTFGRHSSRRVGASPVDRHILQALASHYLETQQGTNNPSGRIIATQGLIPYNEPLGERSLDHTLVLTHPLVRLISADTGFGLETEATDRYSLQETVWTHNLSASAFPGYARQFVACERLCKNHAAATHYAGRIPQEELPDALRQLCLPAGQAYDAVRAMRPMMSWTNRDLPQ